VQVLIKKQQELAARPPVQQEQQQAPQRLKQPQQHSLRAKLKLEPAATVASSRPQGSPAACLTLALPIPGWREQ